MKKKYICYGGYVISRNDGDRHYVSAHNLCSLYEVNPMECYFVDKDNDTCIRGLDLSKFKKLFPLQDGKYRESK